jgi:hypothetical protein
MPPPYDCATSGNGFEIVRFIHSRKREDGNGGFNLGRKLGFVVLWGEGNRKKGGEAGWSQFWNTPGCLKLVSREKLPFDANSSTPRLADSLILS